MSIFSKIEGSDKSFISEVENVWKKFFAAEPKIEQTISTTISVVAPILVSILAATGNEAEAAAIVGIVSIIQSDLVAVQVTLNQAGAGSTVTVSSLLAAINSNLTLLLSAGYVKNPQSLAGITLDVNKITLAIEVLVAGLATVKV